MIIALRWMTAIGLVLLFDLALAAAPADEKRIYQLLIIDSQYGNPYDEVRAALSKSLEAYGYVEGRNLRTKLLTTGNDIKAGEAILKAEVNQQHYDVIYVGGSAATISAKNVLYGDMRQRVVFGATTDPVGIGVIKDFSSRPGANFTGVCYPVPVMARFRFIKQLMPTAQILGVVFADMPQSRSYIEWVKQLFDRTSKFEDLTVIFRSVPLVTGEDGDQLMAEAAVKHIKALDPEVDAFIKPNDQMGTRRYFSEKVYQTATKPLIGLVKDDVMEHWGATAVIYSSHQSIGKQAGRMIGDLFAGAKIADIVPEWPKEYGVAVDLAKARQFGLRVPIEILQMAGENIIK